MEKFLNFLDRKFIQRNYFVSVPKQRVGDVSLLLSLKSDLSLELDFHSPKQLAVPVPRMQKQTACPLLVFKDIYRSCGPHHETRVIRTEESSKLHAEMCLNHKLWLLRYYETVMHNKSPSLQKGSHLNRKVQLCARGSGAIFTQRKAYFSLRQQCLV